TEKTTDLSGYPNVYVRVFINTTSAIRYVDDFSITYSGGLSTVYTTAPGCDAPLFSVSATELTGFTYIAGNDPSTSDSFTLSGVNLDGSAITVTAPANFEVSTDNTSFDSSLNLSSTDGTLAETTVYVRLMAG